MLIIPRDLKDMQRHRYRHMLQKEFQHESGYKGSLAWHRPKITPFKAMQLLSFSKARLEQMHGMMLAGLPWTVNLLQSDPFLLCWCRDHL